MNVLSLFDGLGGGYLALDRVSIKPTKYFASEVDKYAIAVAEALHPDIIKLGDVTKWREWDLPKIDLLIGGSPCQSFSFAGKRNGMSTGDIEVTSLEQYEQLKVDGYKFDGQSYLFWEYVAILKHYKPKYFLLENVIMEKQWKAIISRALGIEPVMINSALVSAQNRKRLYWTNILATSDLLGHMYTAIPQPKDRKIYLKDIIDNDAEEPVLSNIYGGFGEDKPRVHYGKSPTLRASSGSNTPSVCVKGNDEISKPTQIVATVCRPHEYYDGGVKVGNKTSTVTCGFAGDYKLAFTNSTQRNIVCGDEWDKPGGDITHIRKFNVNELARLQTLPDNFIDVARLVSTSNTQIAKMIGNGWTIDVIAHIFSFLETS